MNYTLLANSVDGSRSLSLGQEGIECGTVDDNKSLGLGQGEMAGCGLKSGIADELWKDGEKEFSKGRKYFVESCTNGEEVKKNLELLQNTYRSGSW